MKLYKISQSRNTDWYTYDSAIVVANSEEEARETIPSPFYFYDEAFYYKYKHQEPAVEKTDPSWCHPKYVKVEQIGTTRQPKGVVCASMRGGMDESRATDIARVRGAMRYTLPDSQATKVKILLNDYIKQVADTNLSFLRYHLIEANRIHDIEKVLEYERKIKDYMDEEFEDWS